MALKTMDSGQRMHLVFCVKHQRLDQVFSMRSHILPYIKTHGYQPMNQTFSMLYNSIGLRPVRNTKN